MNDLHFIHIFQLKSVQKSTKSDAQSATDDTSLSTTQLSTTTIVEVVGNTYWIFIKCKITHIPSTYRHMHDNGFVPKRIKETN